MSDPQNQLRRYPSSKLSWVERFAIFIGRTINRPGIVRRLSVWWGRIFTCSVLKKISGHRWIHYHPERIDLINDSAPILFVSNHRTFFDMYVGITALRYMSNYRIGAPAVFPVRSPFFYDHPLGILINLVASGSCMWPPVFRDDRRSVLNPISTNIMENLLKQDGVTFGFHPEGRRSKSQDIYTLEPAKRGVGQLVANADERLVILPVFISGLSGDAKKEWRLRKKEAATTHPIRFYWGHPKSPQDFHGSSEDIAKQIHESIQQLAEQARQEES